MSWTTGKARLVDPRRFPNTKEVTCHCRVRTAENNARENKAALGQLIMHTKNVERAVNVSQQEIVAKKEQQAQK